MTSNALACQSKSVGIKGDYGPQSLSVHMGLFLVLTMLITTNTFAVPCVSLVCGSQWLYRLYGPCNKRVFVLGLGMTSSPSG